MHRQLSLEQHGFELCASTYMWISFNKYLYCLIQDQEAEGWQHSLVFATLSREHPPILVSTGGPELTDKEGQLKCWEVNSYMQIFNLIFFINNDSYNWKKHLIDFFTLSQKFNFNACITIFFGCYNSMYIVLSKSFCTYAWNIIGRRL